MANLLIYVQAFINADFSLLSESITDLGETITKARKHGDVVYRDSVVALINIDLGGYTLTDLTYKDLLDIQAVIPSFTRDIQKTLLSILNYAESPMGCQNLEEMDEVEFENQHNGLLGICFNPSVNQKREVTNIRTWYNFHRCYFIYQVPTKENFCQSLKSFFPNLHLNQASIIAGLNTFNGTRYSEVMETIIYHLSALNDDYSELFKLHKKDGADTACDKLEMLYASKEIKLAASRDQHGIRELNFTIMDDKGNTKRLDCNLHTKFEEYFEITLPTREQKSNRIYFHQPDENFIKDKILVARIGKHRE